MDSRHKVLVLRSPEVCVLNTSIRSIANVALLIPTLRVSHRYRLLLRSSHCCMNAAAAVVLKMDILDVVAQQPGTDACIVWECKSKVLPEDVDEFRERTTFHFPITDTIAQWWTAEAERVGVKTEIFEEEVFDTLNFELLRKGNWLIRRTPVCEPGECTWKLKVSCQQSDTGIQFKERRFDSSFQPPPLSLILRWHTTRYSLKGSERKIWIDISSWYAENRCFVYNVCSSTVDPGQRDYDMDFLRAVFHVSALSPSKSIAHLIGAKLRKVLEILPAGSYCPDLIHNNPVSSEVHAAFHDAYIFNRERAIERLQRERRAMIRGVVWDEEKDEDGDEDGDLDE